VERIVAATKSSGMVRARRTARSFSGWVAMIVASDCEPS
jgi:hypothetical protein